MRFLMALLSVLTVWRVRRQLPVLAKQARLNPVKMGNFGRYRRPLNWR